MNRGYALKTPLRNQFLERGAELLQAPQRDAALGRLGQVHDTSRELRLVVVVDLVVAVEGSRS